MKGFAVAVMLLSMPAFTMGSTVTPVQKVIGLMQGMLKKGRDEKKAEQVQFSAYKQFCIDTIAEKAAAIATAEETIESLKADIQKDTADAARLGKEIASHEEDIAVWKGDEVAATKVRKFDKTDYDATHKDYSESVDALTRAIAVLKKQDYDRKQASFVQTDVASLTKLNLIPDHAKQAINLFLAQGMEQSAIGATAPEANAYEFQSSSIIDMLNKLLDKFIDERTALEKQEMMSKSAYEVLMQELAAEIAQATKEVNQKSALKAQTLQDKANAEGDLTDTTTTMEADIKYKTDLTATCSQKATDFEARQTLRAEELEAIEKAIEIIGSGSVSGAADKYLPSSAAALLQKSSSKKALAQLRASEIHITQERAAQYLQLQGEKLNSRVLSTLAVHVSDDPFKKVKKMIKDLIVRLMEEATEEAEHKGWCDTELSTNAQTREEKTEAVEKLTAQLDELETSVAKLTEDLAALSKAIADLDAAMAKATKMRAEEKATNTETIADAQEAQTAVAQALVVLKEFYAKAGEATALVQQTPPAIFDSPYKGMQAENGGVVGMLEVIESDFARLEADTDAAETAAQKEYETFMTDSKVDKAAKETDVENKTQKKQDESAALSVKREDLSGTQKELDAALAYYDKLKPSCIGAGVSFEDRVGRRKEEIQSLQEALRILNGEDV